MFLYILLFYKYANSYLYVILFTPISLTNSMLYKYQAKMQKAKHWGEVSFIQKEEELSNIIHFGYSLNEIVLIQLSTFRGG